MTLPPHLAELERYLDDTRVTLLTLVAKMPEPALRKRPAPDTWSGAEIIDHLRAVEGSIVKVLRKLLREAPVRDEASESADSASVMGALDRFRIPERLRRVEAPELVRPAPDPEPARSLAALAESRGALKAVLRESQSRAVTGSIYPHTLLGPLSFFEWVLFAAQHEERHSLQLREVLDQSVGPELSDGGWPR